VNGEWGMGNGEWGMGNGGWGMGNGEWGMGNGDLRTPMNSWRSWRLGGMPPACYANVNKLSFLAIFA